MVRIFWKILAVILIFWGVVALFTPLTPGSWLFFVGLIIIFGRKRTEDRLFKIIGKKWFNKLRIKKMLSKIPTKWNGF